MKTSPWRRQAVRRWIRAGIGLLALFIIAAAATRGPSALATRLSLIAFQCGRHICVMNSDGSQVRQLTHGSASDEGPSWSPDRRHIAFSSNRWRGFLLKVAPDLCCSQIYIMDSDGTHLRRLTHSRGSDEGPKWSPDGTKLVYQSDRNGSNDIYVIGLDGLRESRLTHDPQGAGDPAWSPDGG